MLSPGGGEVEMGKEEDSPPKIKEENWKYLQPMADAWLSLDRGDLYFFFMFF